MTTIVITNNQVFGDGQATGVGVANYHTKKILNLGSCIVAGAGRWSHVVKFQQWIQANVEAMDVQDANPHVHVSMPEDMVDEDFYGLILYPDGVVMMYEGCQNFYEVPQPVCIGSGGVWAEGSLFAKPEDGETAIKAAIYRDPYSGGDIQIEGFDEEPEPLTEETMKGMSKEQILAVLFPTEQEQEQEGKVEETEEDVEVFEEVELMEDDSLGGVDINTTTSLVDLKDVAKTIGIPFGNAIGLESLRERILNVLNKAV